MKIQLNFCGVVCVYWHLYLQSVHSVSVDLAVRSPQVSLRLVIYWPSDYMQSWMGVQSLPMCEIDFITLSSLRSSQKHDVRSNFVNWIEILDTWFIWEYLLIHVIHVPVSTPLLWYLGIQYSSPSLLKWVFWLAEYLI